MPIFPTTLFLSSQRSCEVGLVRRDHLLPKMALHVIAADQFKEMVQDLILASACDLKGNIQEPILPFVSSNKTQEK